MLFICVLYLIIIILFFVLIQKINNDQENFTTSSIPKIPKIPELISSYWNKYMHFVNKRSKCIDCDNSSSMDHPYRELQIK